LWFAVPEECRDTRIGGHRHKIQTRDLANKKQEFFPLDRDIPCAPQFNDLAGYKNSYE
jgi:hypothetical protein